MPAPRRLFVAIELPADVRDDAERAIVGLRGEAPELEWTRPECRHVTMKFLGDVEPDRVDTIRSTMEQVARAHRPFSLCLAHVGAFPNFRKARVVWLGVEFEPRLELLQHDLEIAASGIGFELEGRAFRPHVTLARAKAPLEIDRARRLARAARKVDFTASVDVAELTLFESTRAPTGAQHGRIHAATLGGC
jgi:2'-5' RNA ligase